MNPTQPDTTRRKEAKSGPGAAVGHDLSRNRFVDLIEEYTWTLRRVSFSVDNPNGISLKLALPCIPLDLFPLG